MSNVNIKLSGMLDRELLSIFAEHLLPRLIVRGLYRYEHAGFMGDFVPYAPVTLEREPENSKDTNAVKVILSNGEMLGYIAKETAPVISRDLAEGVQFIVRIADTPFCERKWGQCELDVYRKVPRMAFDKLEMISRANHNMSIQYDPRGGVMHASSCRTKLCDAVERNDVEQAREILAQGWDSNEMAFKIYMHHPLVCFCSQPLLSKIRSLDMYKAFVEAGAEIYPKSYILDGGRASVPGCRLPFVKIYGQEHNLLEALWAGPSMDNMAIELADYLVITEYEMRLRSKIDEIRNSFDHEDGGPYKNNREYVLEWCDMEKRAIAAFSKYVDGLHEYSPYSLGHDVSVFLDDWKRYGYDYACRNPEVGEDEIPPRYVYPERILKRGSLQSH